MKTINKVIIRLYPTKDSEGSHFSLQEVETIAEEYKNLFVIRAKTEELLLLKQLQGYFGEHDKTQQEHSFFARIEKAIKELKLPPTELEIQEATQKASECYFEPQDDVAFIDSDNKCQMFNYVFNLGVKFALTGSSEAV